MHYSQHIFTSHNIAFATVQISTEMSGESTKDDLIARLSSRPQPAHETSAIEPSMLDSFLKRIDEAKTDMAKELYDITVTATPANRLETNERLLKYVSLR